MRGFLHILLALFFGSAVGWISALGMIENYGLMPVAGNAYWSERRAAPGEAYAYYSTAYFVQQGQLPPPAGARFFVRSRDDDGGLIRSDCVYVAEGTPLSVRWWSFGLNNGLGQVRGIGAGEVIREGNGVMRLFLSGEPVPGSRILSPGGSSLTLTSAVHEAAAVNDALALPTLKKVGC